MHWATETAHQIIKEKGDKPSYTLASGISPSGNVHIGNFREFITTYFVAKELEHLGKKVRFIFSWDDYDRLRKIPKDVTTISESNIGMPYSSVISPDGKEESYARYFQKKFEAELEAMDVEAELIYQTKEYTSGRYNKNIIEAIEKRREIYDILQSYKTQEPTEQMRNAYYPVSVYCGACNKDFTTVTAYNADNNELTYTCKCGHTETTDVKEASNMKLDWKVDWPMRWRAEQVDFEPGGRDHASENGSYTVCSEVSKKIFGYEAPMFLKYEWIGIKGLQGSMGSSLGNAVTLTQLLKVYDRHLIKWFYAKYKSTAPFDLSFDQDVLRYYGEFDRFVKAYFADKPIGETARDNIRLTAVTPEYMDTTSFNYLATFMPMVNYNDEMLKDLMQKEGVDTSNQNYADRKERAKFWLDNYAGDFKLNVLDEFNKEYYNSMDEVSKENIVKTLSILNSKTFESATDLQNELYHIPLDGSEEDDPKAKKTKQKGFFKHLYNLTLGENKGPKLGLFLLALPNEKINKLLKG